MVGDDRETPGTLRITASVVGGISVLRLEGELDLASAPSLRAAVLHAAGSSCTAPVVLDMAGVTFIDSTGVRTLLEAQQGVSAEVILMAPSGPVTRVLDLTRLRGHFPEIDARDDLSSLRT